MIYDDVKYSNDEIIVITKWKQELDSFVNKTLPVGLITKICEIEHHQYIEWSKDMWKTQRSTAPLCFFKVQKANKQERFLYHMGEQKAMVKREEE